ncbi:MAG: U32 family peptidase C-terminal domain-containing protein [Lachnospiraceae bacterium]|nr:U32 family peptidase C-terminal domain-containing protein [Lachnospiraceae bacterium]
MTDRKKPELLCPASSLEVLKCAVRYGADAVYIGGEAFGLRAKAKNFTMEEMAEGIAFAHAYGVRVHVTANILAHNYDLTGARKYFEELRDLKHVISDKDMIWVEAARESIAAREAAGKVIEVSGSRNRLEKEYLENWNAGYEVTAHPDALIVADPGMYTICREVWPESEIHISTQANNTNYETYKFWWKMGAKRVVSARELSLREIAEIRQNIPEEMEIESFIHGAMCISYSGRCLLSNFFTGRDANHGACTHPCRWKYSVAEVGAKRNFECGDCGSQECDNYESEEHEIRYAVEEESRPGEYLPVYENERGTYIFNSRDLCMIEHIPDLINAGIDSWKIEGRMKTALYVATVARTYRRAIDDYFENPAKYEANLPWYREQIAKCTYRKFCTGFFYGKPDEESQIYDNNTYSSDAVYLAMIEELKSGVMPEGTVAETASGSADEGKDTASGSVGEGKDTASGSAEVTLARFEQKNKFCVGDKLEIMKADGRELIVTVEAMYHLCTGDDLQSGSLSHSKAIDTVWGKIIPVESCPHSREQVWIKLSELPETGDLLRK